jgi:D-3-phosphoglycerate dehydrogenase / 2-oxoglutarate reductase
MHDAAGVIDVARDADALMVHKVPISAEVISQLKRCRIISRYGIGLDGIDVAAATARGIAVVANSDYCIREVAEHALALLLACARRLGPAMAAARAGNWNKRSFMKPLVSLSEQTLGIVGFGRIGKQLAELAGPLVARVVVFDPFLTASPQSEIVTFDELLSAADFISLHCPLTEGTTSLFTERIFRKMKPTAWLINVARGQIVDEADLLTALANGTIAGAALDVFHTEPLDAAHPLLGLPNVLATPHVAWYSERAYHLLQENTAKAVIDYLRA